MRSISFTQALREALTEEMRRDPDVLLLGEDIAEYGGAFGVTRGLFAEFGPERVINTPISEAGFVGAAIGASLVGSRPVVEIMFMDFITLAVDQLVNQAAKLRYVFGKQARCPIVVRTPAGGGRCYGPTHSQSLEAWFVHVPGLKVAAPATPADAKGLLLTAIRDDNPVLFIEHKMLYNVKGDVPLRAARPVPFGKARRAKPGADATVVAWSWMAHRSEEAARELAADGGPDAEVLDLRTLNPLDADAVVESVRRTRRLLIVEENWRTGGVGAEIASRVCERAYGDLEAPVRRLATLDVPLAASPELERAALPDKDRIRNVIVELVDSKGRP